jgi:hypothetical protein
MQTTIAQPLNLRPSPVRKRRRLNAVATWPEAVRNVVCANQALAKELYHRPFHVVGGVPWQLQQFVPMA